MTDPTLTSSPRRPLRTCLGCRTTRNKEELIRIACPAGKEPVVDRTGKTGGRGAYLCGDAACLKRARKSNALGRALRTRIPDSLYEELAGLFESPSGREVQEPRQ